MRKHATNFNRRTFIKATSILATGVAGFSLVPQNAWGKKSGDEGVNVIGPKEGFSPQIGTLVSMMNWMRLHVVKPVQKLTVEQLDYLHDSKSNTIGALLLHLAAIERYYQLHTFEGMKWGSWGDDIKKRWDVPVNLGEEARKTIKGQPIDYYLNILKEVRNNTIQELKKKDDKWLMAVDKEWPWGPTDNYCKWFHVCEHESHHSGQMSWLKSRLPGINAASE